jgi:hypothetical protein
MGEVNPDLHCFIGGKHAGFDVVHHRGDLAVEERGDQLVSARPSVENIIGGESGGPTGLERCLENVCGLSPSFPVREKKRIESIPPPRKSPLRGGFWVADFLWG